MARKRMITPTIWTNRKFIRLSFTQRLLFIGLISQADDEGRLWNDGLALKAAIFPADSLSLEEVESGLERLASVGFLTKDENSIQLNGWEEHQAVPKPVPSTIPIPQKGGEFRDYRTTTEPLPNQYGSDTEPLQEDYRTTTEPLPPKERKKERKERKEINISAPGKPEQPLDPLYHVLMKAMEEKKGEPFANYGQEGQNAKLLLKRLRGIEKNHTDEALQSILETYYRLTKSSDRFWGGQPFTPSRLLSHLEAVITEAKKGIPSLEEEALAELIYGRAK